jgi:L-arabinokinase
MLPSQAWALDVGVAQHDGLDLDIDETRRRWAAFSEAFDERADAEAKLLREQGVDVVLGDVPPLAFAASARAGIPSFALANFGWDWIYGAWPDFEAPIAQIQAAYCEAYRLFRLPLHSKSQDAFPAFERIEQVPLIARCAQRERSAVRADLGIAQDARAVLVSFGGFAADGLDLQALGQWTRYLFVLTPPMAMHAAEMPPNVVALPRTPTDFVSLIGACDAVVTKPGYGIVADCLANRVPMLYTDRGPFREYDVLADALPRLSRACYLPRRDVLAGQLGPTLDALLDSTASWTDQPMDGARIVAQRLLARA